MEHPTSRVARVACLILVLMFSLPPNVRAESISLNYSGYVAAINFSAPQPGVSGVSARWVVPSVEANSSARSAIWIGIGGYFSNLPVMDTKIIQMGTEQDITCFPKPPNCKVEYFAWVATFPGPILGVPIVISPGDTVEASIEQINDGYTWRAVLTKNPGSFGSESYSRVLKFESKMLSANWIVERPQFDEALTSLANFHTIVFSRAKAKVNGVDNWLDVLNKEAVVMYEHNGRVLAIPSPVSDSGFRVCFGPVKCLP